MGVVWEGVVVVDCVCRWLRIVCESVCECVRVGVRVCESECVRVLLFLL